MRQLIISLALLFTFSISWASERFQNFVNLKNGHTVYVDYKPAKAGHETVVLLNGLTYETPSWDSLVAALDRSGLGVLRYDPMGMGESLIRAQGVKAPVKIEDQAEDLNLVTQKMGLKGKLNLVGLSYGGGLAIAFADKYSTRIANAILMCPYTEPLATQDAMIRSQVAMARVSFPFNQASNEELYAYFLKQNVYFVYPLSEPAVMANVYKPEAVFQMTQGIRKFNMLNASQKFPAHSVHLVIAGADQYIPRGVLESFWEQLPQAAKASKVIVDYSEHKIPEAYPKTAAGIIKLIVQEKDRRMFQGRHYQVDPILGHTKELAD